MSLLLFFLSEYYLFHFNCQMSYANIPRCLARSSFVQKFSHAFEDLFFFFCQPVKIYYRKNFLVENWFSLFFWHLWHCFEKKKNYNCRLIWNVIKWISAYWFLLYKSHVIFCLFFHFLFLAYIGQYLAYDTVHKNYRCCFCYTLMFLFSFISDSWL